MSLYIDDLWSCSLCRPCGSLMTTVSWLKMGRISIPSWLPVFGFSAIHKEIQVRIYPRRKCSLLCQLDVSTVGKNMFLDCGYSCLVVGTQGHSGKSMVLVLVYYALKRVVVVYWGIVFHKILSFFLWCIRRQSMNCKATRKSQKSSCGWRYSLHMCWI